MATGLRRGEGDGSGSRLTPRSGGVEGGGGDAKSSLQEGRG